MSPHEILIQARALIENSERWTQLAFARNEEGAKCPVTSPRACKWCATGAVQRIAYLNNVSAALALTYLNTSSSEVDAIHLNDCRGHAEVLQMFNDAIERAGP